jgi:hypothetical protein
MINSRSIIAAATVGVLGGALFALWATVAEAQASSGPPPQAPARQVAPPSGPTSFASR